MRQTLLLLFIALAICNCNSPTETKIESGSDSLITKQVVGKKFFEYDEIDYYFSDLYKSKLEELYDNPPKTEIDSFKLGVVLGGIPKDISDLSFIRILDKIGFKKSYLDKATFVEIDSFFVEKQVKEILVSKCIYVYRDILIFKKNNKVIGTAKICFGCRGHEITGTTANTNNFGQDGDYSKLEKLLRK